MSETTKKVQLPIPESIHSEIVDIQSKLKEKGISMSIANIIVRFLEINKGKITTGYEK